MPEESRLSLMNYRLEQAQACLDAAIVLTENGAYKDATNRSYYCVFHAMRAVLALDSYDSKKHSGIISVFRQKYIKTGVFPVELSDTIEAAFQARGSSDYEDFFVISKEDVQQQIENAKVFLTTIKKYIETIQN